MDAYQQQGQHHRFLRPPPPSTSDPYHHHHQQQQQQQPLPPQQPHPHHQQWYPNHAPPPPLQQQQQWGPQPPPPPQHQYHHAPPHNQYPLPPPPLPPRPPSHYAPQPYAQPLNQDWGAQNWAHHQHQGWDYQAQTHEEDWGAKARAWAEANKSTPAQHQHQPQLAPPPPPEQSHYHHEQYPNQSLPSSSYQQFQAHQPPVNLSPAARDGALGSDSSAVMQRQGNLPSPSVHQQEVPYSYSSVTGNGGGIPPMSNSAPHEGQNNIQPPPSVPLSDQPLEFAPRFNHDNQPMQSSYSYLDPAGPTRDMDAVSTGPSMNNWTAHYPPIPPGLPPVPQHDPALVVPQGPSVPQFSSFPGSSLQSTVPSTGPHFALGAVTPLHHNTVFSGNAYGIPSLSERPKKASVPNWLKEEIKKTVITTPSLDYPKEENHSLEDEVDYRSALEKGDQEDSKSIDSSRSAEEDEEDKDYEDAARTAAINHEIKRILTEVLLKVTDELFDEIATKVLDESNLPVEVDKSMVTPNHKTPISTSTLPTPKEDSKPPIVGTSKEPETEGIIAKSISIAPGDLLGLADYATDDDDEDEDNEIQTLSSTNPKRNDVDANGSSLEQPVSNRKETNLEGDPSVPVSTVSKHSSPSKSLPDDSIPSRSEDTVGIVRSDLPDDIDSEMKTLKDNNQVKETKPDKNDHHERKKSFEKDFKKEEDSMKLRTDKDNGNRKKIDEKHSRREKTDEPNSSKDRRKEQSTKHLERAHETESKKRSSHFDDKEDKKKRERTHKDGSKDESSRKREHSKDSKDRNDERSRHKRSSDSSRNKKRRSSSVSRGRNSKDNSGHRDNNDTSDDASNDSKRKSHSRRRNFSPSPSPVKSKRRQVSRSPHSKHSLRRHSPYSSHETNRVRRSRSRSRSRSPVRRHR